MRVRGLGVGAILLIAYPALAEPSTLTFECSALSTEQGSQVEARVLASLLALDEYDVKLGLSCPPHAALAVLEWSGGAIERSLVADPSNVAEALLQAADLALSDLSVARANAIESAAEAKNASDAAAASDRRTFATLDSSGRLQPEERAEPPSRPATPLPLPEPADRLSLHVEGVLEEWGSRIAWGGTIGAERQVGRVWYGLALAALIAETAMDDFRASEWGAGFELGLAPGAFGMRAAVQVGVSALLIEPAGAASATWRGSALAGFAGLEVTRPIWFGDWGLLPGAGLRAFSAERTVNLDGEQRLQLLTPVFHARLGVLYHAL